MNLNLLLAGGCLGCLTIAVVQAETDAVREAIEKFEKSRRKPPVEVTVVLEPPPPLAVPVTEAELEPPATTDPVTPPQDSQPAEAEPAELIPQPEPPPAPATDPEPEPKPESEQSPPAAPAEQKTPETSASPPPPSGVAVSVRKIEAGGQTLDTSALKIHAPFPAKPLAQAPAGWRIEPSENVASFSEDVELEKGKVITLSVKPHVLVPDADGFLSFSVPEPGYDPGLEYHQNATIGAVLARSIEQMDEDSKQLGSALEQLEQLLISLPKPKAQPVSNIEP